MFLQADLIPTTSIHHPSLPLRMILWAPLTIMWCVILVCMLGPMDHLLHKFKENVVDVVGSLGTSAGYD